MSYVFTVPECVISQKAELQDTGALSTLAVEYMATIETSKEAYNIQLSSPCGLGYKLGQVVFFIHLQLHCCEIRSDKASSFTQQSTSKQYYYHCDVE